MLVPLLGACDLPTEFPKWDTTWILPVDGTTVGVGSLLPPSVTISGNGTQFAVAVQPVTFSRTLEQLCPPCAQLHGQTVPKPAFTQTFSASTSLPAEVISAQLTSGAVAVRLQHDLSFDPIRPSATTRGRVVLVITSGSREIARDTINGTVTPFPAGQPLLRTLALAPGVVSGALTVAVELFSPAGDPITIDRTDALTVTATPQNILLSQAQVRATNRVVSANQVELDVGEIDDELANRILSGALLLTLDEDLTFSGNLDFTATAPGMTPIQKTVPVQAGNNEVRIDFTEPEIRSIVDNNPVVVTLTGTVSTPTEGIALTPSQAFEVEVRLELSIATER